MPDVKPKIKHSQHPRALIYSNHVVTLAEAVILTGKSRTAIMLAIQTGKITGRPSFTGGEWLVVYTSLIDHYGLRYGIWENVISGSQQPLPETTAG